jgi:type VI secretion system protein ImpF
MSRVRPNQPLVPSVLDRLLDYDPQVSREAPASQHQVLRELKQSVRRDLENLLNTRVRNLSWPPHLEELNRSLVDYGLPDFTGMSLGSADDRAAFCRLVEAVIRRYEPRFQSVSVQPQDSAEPLDRTLRFRIDALLRVEPVPEPVVFDSVVEPTTGDFQVRGASA